MLAESTSRSWHSKFCILNFVQLKKKLRSKFVGDHYYVEDVMFCQRFFFGRQYFELCYVVPTNFFIGNSFMELICDQ